MGITCKIQKATPKGGQCCKYPFTTAVAEKTQDTLVPVHKVVGCRSMDECTRFPPDSLSFLPTGYYGFIPLDDLFTDINQFVLPRESTLNIHLFYVANPIVRRSIFDGAKLQIIYDISNRNQRKNK